MNLPEVPDYTHLRFQYEVLGMSPQEIAEANPPMNAFAVEQLVAELSWSEPAAQNGVATQAHTLASMSAEEATEELIASAKAELTRASVMKQLALFNRFASAESQLLTKITQAIDEANPTDVKAIKDLVGAFQALTTQNPLMTVKMANDEDGDGKVVVQVLNQVSAS